MKIDFKVMVTAITAILVTGYFGYTKNRENKELHNKIENLEFVIKTNESTMKVNNEIIDDLHEEIHALKNDLK